MGQIFDKLCAGGGISTKLWDLDGNQSKVQELGRIMFIVFIPHIATIILYSGAAVNLYLVTSQRDFPILKVQHTKVDLSSTAVTVLRRVFLIVG